MTVASIPSRALLGIDAVEVTVEAHLSAGLPGFTLVGLPETAVKESRERVRSAIINSALEFPDQRVTVNLAPADLPKAGGRYDLAIAVATLVASEQIEGFARAIRGIEMLGELALDGSLRPVPGVAQALLAARKDGRAIIVPAANREALEIVDYSLALGLDSLTELIALSLQLKADESTVLAIFEAARAARPKVQQRDPLKKHTADAGVQFNPIRGQARALRALEIAAAGGHNLLMLGPPGSGKTLLATTLSKLLPPMTRDEALEVASIRSAARGQLALGSAALRPLRSPHHSATIPSLVGGGADAVPGDITLAHRGVLFLDELTEFKPGVLNALREPLEAGKITISRAKYRVVFPANFQLVAAMNPCPCGYASDTRRSCRCSKERIIAYLGKVSGPLIDRFDLIIEVPSLSHAELLSTQSSHSNAEQTAHKERLQWARRRRLIADCRAMQSQRQGALNSDIKASALEDACQLTDTKKAILVKLLEDLKVSARGAHRILRMARTIADYDGDTEVGEIHFLEAASYRRCAAMEGLL
ncbi:YifB family Mg chelatase-like AAA ATPase [Gammaproteobacteria bacterium]|nr:YifB family Mg chelatase-like AAA ATPase [Gammaproteobacteria bacterium]